MSSKSIYLSDITLCRIAVRIKEDIPKVTGQLFGHIQTQLMITIIINSSKFLSLDLVCLTFTCTDEF